MSNNGGMTLTEFLEARIAEDEKTAKALLEDLSEQIAEDYLWAAADEKGPMSPARLLSAQLWAHYDGQSKRRSFAKGQQIAVLANPQRAIAECAAKRTILGTYRAVAANHNTEGTAQWYEEKALLTSVKTIATVYEDHPDYRQEWAL